MSVHKENHWVAMLNLQVWIDEVKSNTTDQAFKARKKDFP